MLPRQEPTDWRRERAGKTGSWNGAAGRETLAHRPWSGGTRVTLPIPPGYRRGRGRERAGEGGWAVPWVGRVHRGVSQSLASPLGEVVSLPGRRAPGVCVRGLRSWAAPTVARGVPGLPAAPNACPAAASY